MQLQGIPRLLLSLHAVFIGLCKLSNALMIAFRTPLLAGVAQNLVNLALDLFLIGYAGWGVRGAAAAVSFAQVSLTTFL